MPRLSLQGIDNVCSAAQNNIIPYPLYALPPVDPVAQDQQQAEVRSTEWAAAACVAVIVLLALAGSFSLYASQVSMHIVSAAIYIEYRQKSCMHGISQYYVAPRCGNPYKSTFCYVQALSCNASVSQSARASYASCRQTQHHSSTSSPDWDLLQGLQIRQVRNKALKLEARVLELSGGNQPSAPPISAADEWQYRKSFEQPHKL